MIGRHVIIDGIFPDDMRDKMSNREYLSDYLERVTKITGMTLVFPPMAMKFPFAGETNKLIAQLDTEGKCNDSEIFQQFKQHVLDRNTDGGGVSAIAVWVESHCTVHSWTERNYISIDLFSCSTYDEAPVINYTIQSLGLCSGSYTIVDRFMSGMKPIIQVYSHPEWIAKQITDSANPQISDTLVCH